MRRILQIGTGIRSWINFKEDDIFLGCEPMRSRMQDSNKFHLPPDFVESHIYEGVICSKRFRGTVDYAISKKCDHRLEKGFLLDSTKNRPAAYDVLTVPCLSLDELLEKYKAQGFTKSIDFLNSSISIATINDVFREFSWVVKPKIVALASADEVTVEIFEAAGYNVFKETHPFLSVFLADKEEIRLE